MTAPLKKQTEPTTELTGSPSTQLEQVKLLIAELSKIEDINEKKAQLEKAYTVLRSSPQSKETARALFTTLLLYAEKTRYNNDGEEGMHDTRRILQWSMACQLSGNVAEILAYESLEQLRTHSPASDPTTHCSTISNQLASHSEEEKSLFTNSLRLYSYACQNIDSLVKPEMLSWHKEMYTVLVDLLKDKPEELAEFRYNKDAFLVELEGKDEEEQAKSYDPILKLFEQAWGTADERYQGKLSQVRNMQAIMTFRQKNEGWQPRALAYAQEAVAIREALPEPTDLEKKYPHGFLLANARSVLARILAEGDEVQLTAAKVTIAKSLAFATEWRAKGKNDDYFNSYDRVATVIKAAEESQLLQK